MAPLHLKPEDMCIKIGGPDCQHPYSASILNISAMSYGSLSKNAILALSRGAKRGGFAHNTGEGGISPYHFEGGADIIWQIGTGYFGCRSSDGTFSPELFAEQTAHPQIKMIELKLSQGAKPGHGGILIEGLIFVHNALVGYSLRSRIRVLASGKVASGFGLMKRLALGADACYSARGMMLALGCIQALQCNSNHCPVGVATQNAWLMAGLDPTSKSVRVANFHRETMKSLCEMLGAIGLACPSELRPWHVMHRVSPTETKHYGELYDFLDDGELLREPLPADYKRACEAASSKTFAHAHH